MNRGRSRDRDSTGSSAREKTLRSARSRDRSRNTPLKTTNTSTNPTIEAKSNTDLQATSTEELRNDLRNESPEISGDRRETESKWIEAPHTIGGQKPIDNICQEIPTNPALSSPKQLSMDRSTIAERVAVRKRKTRNHNPTNYVTPQNLLQLEQESGYRFPRPRTLTPPMTPPNKRIRKTCPPTINCVVPTPTASKKRTLSASPFIHSRDRNPQPHSLLPALDLPAALRPLRDDIVKHMKLLQEQTLQILSNKIDELSAENESLRAKINTIFTGLQKKPVRWKNEDVLEEEDDRMSYEDHGVISHPEPNPEPAIQPEICNESNGREGTDPSESDRHFHWLQKCFTDCFSLPTEMYKRRKLISFDGVELAKGYNRVIATWQGFYYELRDEDINFRFQVSTPPKEYQPYLLKE